MILLPARMLSPGLYRLTLEGVKPGGQGYVVGEYPFRVEKAGDLTLLCQIRAPAPPGHQCPGYAGTEKPAEAGSEVRAAP